MQRSLTSLIVGVVLGVAAVVLMALYLRSAQTTQAEALSNIVVSATDFNLGSPLSPASLKVAQWPVSAIPKDSFSSVPDIFKGVTEPGDRVALKAIKSGEPILMTNISGFGGRPTMSREVSRGMRAVAISINDVSGVAGFILPGDRVDIMLTRQVESGGANGNNLATDIILQNVVVLGIDQLADQRTDKPVVARTATVEVTTQQAQMLTLAQQAGTLSLALRNAETLDVKPVARVQIPQLYGEVIKPPKPVHHVVASAPGVRVRYGDAEVTEKAVP